MEVLVTILMGITGLLADTRPSIEGTAASIRAAKNLNDFQKGQMLLFLVRNGMSLKEVRSIFGKEASGGAWIHGDSVFELSYPEYGAHICITYEGVVGKSFLPGKLDRQKPEALE